MDWDSLLAICNSDESQCRVVSNGGVLWDGTGHRDSSSVLDTMLRLL